MIPIAKPLIGQEEMDGVLGVMKSGMIAEGPRVKEFEDEFKKYIGADHAIAVNSGTAALHISLLARGIGIGDEVITTPFTFIATANSILYTGAKPVFADVEPDTLNIDPEDIKAKITDRTRAIVPVDLYGHPADMGAIMDIADDHGLVVIEDACQAHGAMYHGKKAGSFDVGCFSFYPTKNMTSGEGGMITCNDEKLADKARMIRSHGSKVRYYHEMLGFNMRMTDIGAAIGLAQLKKVDQFNEKRIANAAYLSQLLKAVDGIETPTVRPDCKHVFHQYTVKVTDKSPIRRDELAAALTKAGIGNSVFYPVPVHKQQLYRELGYDESHQIAERASREVLSLPVHPSVSREDIEVVAKTLSNILDITRGV
jgi:dTDP-4-amino-4,6-dideoxygalactose transaminase